MTNGNDAVDYTSDCLDSSPLTKREYFAAMAMQGILAGSQADTGKGVPIVQHQVAGQDAVEYADALIEALNKEVKP